jgi:hypothetical protein
MYYFIKIIFIFSLCLLLPLNTVAKDSNKNTRLTCSAKHLDTGKEVDVKTVTAITRNKVATAQWPLGYPTIAIDDSAFIKLTKNARRFIYYHECAHLKFKIKDEYEADCKSLTLIKEKHELSEIDTRKLVKTLVKEFGMSRRWSELLQCKIF